jgi:hypothetical protein
MVRLAVVIALGTALVPQAIHAQPKSARTVEQFTCKDVMREEGTNREVAIAFLHGFLLGKSGHSNFDLDELHRQSRDFVERCLDDPSAHAVDVMTKIKG